MVRKNTLKPAAFFSYVRSDDRHEDGKISELRERLSSEVRAQTGDEFPIFQDRNDIHWGENWVHRLEQSVDATTFLIPIVTPSFFKSPYCRKEVERFLQRERKLKRSDLILPIYYIECPSAIDLDARGKKDRIAELVFSRQFADWRDRRFEPITSPQSCKMIAHMAQQIGEAIFRGAAGTNSAKQPRDLDFRSTEISQKSEAPNAVQEMMEVEQIPGASLPETKRPPSKTEPPTQIVNPFDRGNHATITEAIRAAIPGDRILVRPGLYDEGIVIDKPLEIIGDGPPGEIVIRATDKDVVLFKTTMGRLSNLKLRQAGGRGCGIEITQGRLDVEGCDISSEGLSCVAVHSGADPRLRRNRIHDGKTNGVFVYENGQGTFEDNEILGNVSAGVEVSTGGSPTFRRNRIHQGQGDGVFVHENGQGTFEDNEIFRNVLAGIEVKTGGSPVFRRNRIHRGKSGGVFVQMNGQGIFEDNDVFDNAFAGVEVKAGGNPTFRHNRIIRNLFQAVFIHDCGGGTFEENDLRENAKGAWYISRNSQTNVKRIGNLEE